MSILTVNLQTGEVTEEELSPEEQLEIANYVDTSRADALKLQITQLEQQQLMPRATREFMLLFMQQSFTPEQLAANFGYQAVKAFDLQITALRTELAAL